MKIRWNEVTWYSKWLALILFILMPFFGFWFGVEYGQVIALVGFVEGGGGAHSVILGGLGGSGTEYYGNTAEWQTMTDDKGKFSIAYPIDFDAQGGLGMGQPSDQWRMGANGDATDSGVLLFKLAIPSAFEPQTNFANATLTVGAGRTDQATAKCFEGEASGLPGEATSTEMIDGVPFTVFHTADAGAGNYYETTSYRAVHAGTCYAIEYTIHSSQIMNYPAEYNLHQFDKGRVMDLMNRIVGTFKFLEK